MTQAKKTRFRQAFLLREDCRTQRKGDKRRVNKDFRLRSTRSKFEFKFQKVDLQDLMVGANIRPLNEIAVAEMLVKVNANGWKVSSQLVVCEVDNFEQNQPRFIVFYNSQISNY